jgi:pimeloyl-ACP methyl ester carboxylesterase
MQPETKYARLGRDRIAYQVLGQGPPDLVLATGLFSHVDIGWEDPGVALYVRSLASFCRVVYFDRRGTGATDPVLSGPLPTMRPPLLVDCQARYWTWGTLGAQIDSAQGSTADHLGKQMTW